MLTFFHVLVVFYMCKLFLNSTWSFFKVLAIYFSCAICKSNKFSTFLSFCAMDGTEEKVVSLMGCMLLLQIINQFFNLFTPNFSMYLNSYNTNITTKINIKLLLFVTTFYNLQLYSSLQKLSHDLSHWMKLRSNTWFSRFSLTEYEEDRWVENFRMAKFFFFFIVNKLHLLLLKRDT